MNIVIAYASVGSGHLKAAEALYEHITSRDKSIKVRLIDSLGRGSLLSGYLYSHGYMFIVKFIPFLWKAGFNLTSCIAFRGICRECMRLINLYIGREFYRMLLESPPEIVISTHFLSSDIATRLKRRKPGLKVYTVITDFGVHPFWAGKGVDAYFVASEFTKEKLLALANSNEKVIVSGIPVGSGFRNHPVRDSVVKQLGMDGSRFTVMISTGSFSIGPVEEIIRLLVNEVQFIVVCASNKSLFLRLKAADYHSVFLYGYTDIMPKLMAVSDIILTKPGGLTISESLSMDLLPVFISIIPGQESRNLEFLSGNNIGIFETDPPRIKELILNLKNTPGYLSNFKDRIRRIKKPFAAEKIYDEIRSSDPGIAH